MDLKESLNIIGEKLGPSVEEILYDGLPEGSESQWQYDEELINDIAEAVNNWVSRLDHLQDPWLVSYFDSNSWTTISKKVTQTEAYKIWYKATKGGKENFDATSDTYFYMGSASEVLDGRHKVDEEEDDFSISYLLNKSFGE
jgi:hypothetical protein